MNKWVFDLALFTLLVAFLIELLQLSPFLEILGLDSKIWDLLPFGNSFSFTDLVAYTFGFFTILLAEYLRIQLK